MLKKMGVALAMVFSTTTLTYAAHPLITDDTGTMGKGKFQVEVNSEFSYDKEKEDGITTKERMSELSTILSYGIVDNVDVVLVVPYQWIRTKEDGVTTSVDGISDISLEVKWRFYEKDGLGFALKPGITLPTGDDEDGLGTGRATSSLFFISTKELEPWAFHLNLGYIRNENKADERKDLWHASIASEVEVIKNLRAVANIGIERNGDKASNDHPAFVLGGVIYSINENLDIDVGIKGALNKPETDYTFLAGLAWRF
ncbi:MAG: transporter [Nitrospirota bacterium]